MFQYDLYNPLHDFKCLILILILFFHWLTIYVLLVSETKINTFKNDRGVEKKKNQNQFNYKVKHEKPTTCAYLKYANNIFLRSSECVFKNR